MAYPPKTIDFNELPEVIKDWLASSASALLVYEINKQYSFVNDKVKILPRTILELITGAIDARDFKQELIKRLLIDDSKADSIIADVKEKILKPIEYDLRRIGIEPTLLATTAPTKRMVPTPESREMPIPTKMSSAPSVTEHIQSNSKTHQESDQPFILYHEHPELRETPRPRPATPPSPPTTSETEIKIKTNKVTPDKPLPPTPPPVRNTNNNQNGTMATRIVHYSNNRTDLDNGTNV
ncbi:MAG: hypothetical protein Q8Q37_01525 [bacterium]|nr:hypothetical protein [bacterium]